MIESAQAAASNTFFSGQGVPVALGDVEHELARLWGPTSEREGGPDLENPAVTRVSLANLVVACLAGGSEAEQAAQALDTVMARHPSRVIVLRQAVGEDRVVRAEVSAHCTLPAPGVPQVCSERIVLLAGTGGVNLLPSAVRPLLEADLPLVLWWVGDPRPFASVFHDLADESTRLVPQLPDPDCEPAALVEALDRGRQHCPYTRDLAWFGITRWRELVAAFFDPAGSHVLLNQLHTVEIAASAGTDQQPARVAAWLAAWLAGQLGWKPQGVRRSGHRLEARFAGPCGSVDLVLQTRHHPGQAQARIEKVAIHARPAEIGDDDRFVLERIGGTDHVHVETCSHTRCSLGRVVHAEEPDVAGRMAAALESSRYDTPYQAALPLLLWLLGADGARAPGT